MAVAPRDDFAWSEETPSAIEDASWWLPFPGAVGGVASIGGVFGLIPFESRRFHPDVDMTLLRRDGSRLMFEFKHSLWRAERERDANAAQQRLFDPDRE